MLTRKTKPWAEENSHRRGFPYGKVFKKKKWAEENLVPKELHL
jgi:hypothetical protein